MGKFCCNLLLIFEVEFIVIFLIDLVELVNNFDVILDDYEKEVSFDDYEKDYDDYGGGY